MAAEAPGCYKISMGLFAGWLPHLCRLCNREMHRDLDLCAPCEQSLAWNRAACPGCGLPRPPGLPGPCPRCVARPPPFEATVAPLIFQGPVRHWIHAAKSARGLGEAKLLSVLLARGIERAGAALPQGIVPVPLTAARLFRRGHNQAVLLAAPLARRFDIAIHRSGVRRSGGARTQRGQSRGARSRSVRGVFRATRRFDGHLAIVDDVMTTGATAAELASTLLTAGAERVDVWVVARVPPPSGINWRDLPPGGRAMCAWKSVRTAS